MAPPPSASRCAKSGPMKPLLAVASFAPGRGECAPPPQQAMLAKPPPIDALGSPHRLRQIFARALLAKPPRRI
jgi:hypothetical protein